MTPDKYTIQETYVDVGPGGHSLYVQEWGNPKAALPIVFVHGGPGGHSDDRFKTSLDPTCQRAVFFDQRGCGKSLPLGSLEHNTIQDLIDDIEEIAERLALTRFILEGVSWGATLALAYALRHPERVTAMVLGGIFTGSMEEIDWINQGRFRDFFPEIWQNYLSQTPKAHQHDPTAYHLEHALGADELRAKRSAYAFMQLEAGLLRLDDRFTPEPFETFDPTSSRIELHYLKHGCFMPDRYILDNAHRLRMPVWLVQGRYDFVCPPKTAYELSRALPDGRLIWTLGGHMPEHESWNVMRTIMAQLTVPHRTAHK